jgi:hypothetical protein
VPATKLRHLPARLSAGAFIANSGLGKLRSDRETAESLQAMATQAYPVLGSLGPVAFARLLGATELALGLALMVPLVPTATVAAALTGFAGGLLGLYARVPGLREPGSWRPTRQGTAVAKDLWLVGMGLSLLADAAQDRLRAKRRRS